MANVYGLKITGITEAKRGFFGETWRLETNISTYFVKIVYCDYHKENYQSSFTVIDFMLNKNIDFISLTVKTKNGDFYCNFNGGIMGFFKFIEDDNTEDYPIERLFELAKIYNLNLKDLKIETEAFDTAVLKKLSWLEMKVSSENTVTARQITDLLTSKADLIARYTKRLKFVFITLHS